MFGGSVQVRDYSYEIILATLVWPERVYTLEDLQAYVYNKVRM